MWRSIFASKFRLGRATDRWEIVETKFFALDALPPLLAPRWRKLLHQLPLRDKAG